MKFTEAKLEQVFIDLLEQERISHVHGSSIDRNDSDVLIKEDLRGFLFNQYQPEGITGESKGQTHTVKYIL